MTEQNAGQTDKFSEVPVVQIAPAVVLLSADMMQSIRIEDIIRQAGGRAFTIDACPTTNTALDVIDSQMPVLILIDLSTPCDTGEIIARCKLRPNSTQIPIYAYGSHVDADSLKSAQQSGADFAWPRSRMMRELETVVHQHVNQPIRYVDGWDDELSASAQAGIVEFNKGDYFEQHELLEEAWLQEPRAVREMYQGILQVGVAFFHIERDNWAGAVKLFRRGLPKLRGLPNVCQGVQLGEFYRAAMDIYLEVEALGRSGLAEFDTSRLPKVNLSE